MVLIAWVLRDQLINWFFFFLRHCRGKPPLKGAFLCLSHQQTREESGILHISLLKLCINGFKNTLLKTEQFFSRAPSLHSRLWH